MIRTTRLWEMSDIFAQRDEPATSLFSRGLVQRVFFVRKRIDRGTTGVRTTRLGVLLAAAVRLAAAFRANVSMRRRVPIPRRTRLIAFQLAHANRHDGAAL